MMAASFKRISQLLEQWPVDKTKKGRDFGEYLKTQIQIAFSTGKFNTSPEESDKNYLSLKRLINNEHKKNFPRKLTTCATGLTAEQCNEALTEEFLNLLKEEEKPLYKKILSRLTFKKKMSRILLKFSNKQTVFRTIFTSSCKFCEGLEKSPHTPVMTKEMLNGLKPQNNQVILDMTFGAGGHSTEILKNNSNVKLLVLDRDPLAYNYALNLSKTYPQVIPLLGRFSELPTLLKEHKISQNSIDGILFDFGCSSMQFDIADRGFSVSKNGPLDMRMDGDRFPDMPTAADVLEFSNEEDIAKILKVYGEEKQAKKIARAIVEARYMFKRLKSTQELADLVNSTLDDEIRSDKLKRPTHNATKTFQALRIFVNNEVNEINYGLLLAQKYLKIGGRLVTITFHSLEDTIVKRHLMGNMIENAANPIPLKYCSHISYLDRSMVDNAMDNCWKALHKHVLVPTFDEIEENPRSRSAKLRVAVKIK